MEYPATFRVAVVTLISQAKHLVLCPLLTQAVGVLSLYTYSSLSGVVGATIPHCSASAEKEV